LSRDGWIPSPEQLILLRRNLTDYFSDDELRALCSEIKVDYERLRGQGKAARASELVRYLAARGRIPELVTHASRLRPNISWGEMPEDLAAGAGSLIERPTPSRRAGPALGWLGWFGLVLIVVAGLIFVVGGGLRQSRPGTAPGPAPSTLTSMPRASTLAAPTPSLAVAAETATPQWTPAPPTETLPPMTTETPEQAPTGTPTLRAMAGTSVPRVVTPLAPLDNACVKSPVITFEWTGAALRPGETFLVAIVPSEVNKGKCSGNYARGVQYSPLLPERKWTADISAPQQVPAACAGPVEWTVYIKSEAGNVSQVGPVQHFVWNPSGCIK